MRIGIANFRGSAPRIAAAALPDNAAQFTLNARLLSANLEAWRNFRLESALCKTPPVNTIFRMAGQFWLQWTQSELAIGAQQVDVAKSTIGGDTTHRIFFTGLDVPRWTNLTLATTGAGCYPIASRPLGVPNPLSPPTTVVGLPSSPVVDATDDGTQFGNWTPVGTINAPGVARYFTVSEVIGDPAPSYELVAMNTPTIAWGMRDYGLGNAAVMKMSVWFNMVTLTVSPPGIASFGIRLGSSDGGVGPALTVERTPAVTNLILGQAGSRDESSTIASNVAVPLGSPAWFKLEMEIQRNPNGTGNAVGTLYGVDGVTVLAQVSGQVQIGGGFIQLSSANNAGPASGHTAIYADNLIIQASGSLNDPSDDFNTSYVYTFVNDVGEESGPSEPSATIVRDNGTSVTITTPTTVPTGFAGYNVVAKRIYRSFTDASGTTFRFVVEIPLATADYVDTLTNSQLGEALTTEDYELPPTDLRSILALPNDIYAGISGNQLCLSAQGAPHAWPVGNRYATDDPPVRIGAIDATVVIATTGFPYLAQGNDPSVFSMNKLELPQGCISYRSLAYLKGVGVIYASADGLVAVSGTGQVTVLTEGLYSKREWSRINPATIIGCVQDDIYFGFYIDPDGFRRGLIIEAKAQGFGVVTLGFHATAVFSDTVKDALFLVLDENFVPSTTGTGAGQQWNPDGGDIYEFDAYAGGTGPQVTPLLPRLWLSKKYLQPYPNCYRYCTVRAVDYDDVWLVVSANGQSYHSQQVLGPEAFVLPDSAADHVEITLVGTSFVENAQLADDAMELA